jgi:hypothetical protein
MKSRKRYLGIAIVIGILCVAVLGEVKLPPPEVEPILIGRPNPALAGIDNLFVTVIHTGEEPNGLVWEKLKAEIDNRLNQAGIKVFSPEPNVCYKLPIWPELKIRVDMLELKQSQQYVFHIQTLLAKNIYVEVKSAFRQKADVWKTEPRMQAVSVQSAPVTITSAVLEQVEVFIHAYLVANPPNKRPSDANDISKVAEEQLKPAAESAPALQHGELAAYKYVASKNSKVFHRPDCHWVKQIKLENLVGYSSREEAINDGKKPCKRCNP